MYNRILCFVFFISLIVSVTGVVYGSEMEENSLSFNELNVQNNNSSSVLIESKSLTVDKSSSVNKNNSSGVLIESKSLSLDKNSSVNKIKKIDKSKSVFKSGTRITLEVFTDKSIKSVSGSIYGKSSYRFIKGKSGYWYYKLNTKGFKTGDYKVNIRAIDNKNKVYRSSSYLTADNVPPKIYTVSTNVKVINAGNPFTVNASADNSTKKIIASIRGKNYSFKYLNDTQWSLNVKLSYKEIKTINISVSAYDSVGNIAKRDTSIQSKPKVIYWNGSVLANKKYKVSYPNPTNAYEKSINLLSKYASVYEGYAGDCYTLGITYRVTYSKKVKYSVTIAYKDPFVVYHELAHVLNWSWSEYNCDWYAYNKTGYWIK